MATHDILSIGEARDAIATTSTQYDDALSLMSTAVSERIDDLVGPVVVRTVTERYDGGEDEIFLRTRPLYAITSITEYRWTTPVTLTEETPGTAPSDAYMIDESDGNGVILRRQGGRDWEFWPGDDNIVVVYQAGRYADTASVGARYKQAAKIILAHLWQNENGIGSNTFGAAEVSAFPASYAIPNRAMELLAGQRRAPGIA